MNYISWALLGMAGYSLVTLFVKLATRNNGFPAFVVLTIATVIVVVSVIMIVLFRGEFQGLVAADLVSRSALWSYATGISLTIAVSSLFMALSLGPATVVVPIYGMFVIGGSVLGLIFLQEPLQIQKVLGIVTAVASVYLITR